jgi:hypothetical protein
MRCILYIVKRKQLHSDDDLRDGLDAQARREVMQALVGIRKDSESISTDEYVRSLRRGHLIARLCPTP